MKARPRRLSVLQVLCPGLSQSGSVLLGSWCPVHPPQRGWPHRAVTGRPRASAQALLVSLWPIGSARPLTVRAEPPQATRKHLLTRWPSLGSITNDKSYLLIICDFWGQPRFPFRDEIFSRRFLPPPTQPPPPKRKAKRRGSPDWLRSAAGPRQPLELEFTPGPVPSLHASGVKSLGFCSICFWLLFSSEVSECSA